MTRPVRVPYTLVRISFQVVHMYGNIGQSRASLGEAIWSNLFAELPDYGHITSSVSHGSNLLEPIVVNASTVKLVARTQNGLGDFRSITERRWLSA